MQTTWFYRCVRIILLKEIKSFSNKFDDININPFFDKKSGPSPKIVADYYIDDKALEFKSLESRKKTIEFLKGFFGYNSNPNYVEFCLWLFFLIFGIKKWADFYYIAPPKKLTFR